MAEELCLSILATLERIDVKFDRVTADLHDVSIRMARLDDGMMTLAGRLDRLDACFAKIETQICGEAA